MTAQSLIARDSTDRSQVIKTTWLLVRMAGFLSLALAGFVSMTFLFGSYMFTHDQDVIDGVHELVVPVCTLSYSISDFCLQEFSRKQPAKRLKAILPLCLCRPCQ